MVKAMIVAGGGNSRPSASAKMRSEHTESMHGYAMATRGEGVEGVEQTLGREIVEGDDAVSPHLPVVDVVPVQLFQATAETVQGISRGSEDEGQCRVSE
jgi:hypothetical protein